MPHSPGMRCTSGIRRVASTPSPRSSASHGSSSARASERCGRASTAPARPRPATAPTRPCRRASARCRGSPAAARRRRPTVAWPAMLPPPGSLVSGGCDGRSSQPGMATYVYDDFRVTFTPRADGTYDVRAADADGGRREGEFTAAAVGRRARAGRARRGAARPARRTRQATPWRDVPTARPARSRATSAATGRRPSTPSGSGGALAEALLGGDVGDGLRAGPDAGREPRARPAPHAVARRRAGAAERAVGVPVPPAAVPRQPAPHAARAPARDGLDGRRRRRSTAPCASSASSPARATSRRSTSTPSGERVEQALAPVVAPGGSSSTGSSRRRRGSLRLALARRQLPRHPLRRPQRLHRARATGCSSSRTPTTARRSRVDETLLRQPAVRPERRCGSSSSTRARAPARRSPIRTPASPRRSSQLGVPAVVAMQFEISDGAAIVFAEELYTNLIGRQDPIDAAVGRGAQGDLHRGRHASSGRRRCCSCATPTSSCSASRSTPRRCRRPTRPATRSCSR